MKKVENRYNHSYEKLSPRLYAPPYTHCLLDCLLNYMLHPPKHNSVAVGTSSLSDSCEAKYEGRTICPPNVLLEG